MLGVLGVIAVIVVLVGGPLVAVLWRSRPRPGQTAMVLLATAAGEAEAKLWADTLRGSGITARVRDVGDFRWVGGGVSPYAYEVWVRPGDQARAREVLGL